MNTFYEPQIKFQSYGTLHIDWLKLYSDRGWGSP